MELENRLQEYLKDAIEEKAFITVEMSFYRQLSDDEIKFMNNELKPYGHFVVCYPCETCGEYTDGKENFHIDRLHF